MYTIKRASSRSGVAAPTIRAWERRYGVVSPARTASGYRLYDDVALERLTRMRLLVSEGWQPSAAAAAILAGTAAATQPAETSGADSTRAVEEAAAELARRFVAAAAELDDVALEHVLDDVFSRGSFERVASDLLFPALAALGDAWAAGTVSVAGEHVASQAVLRRLALALDSAGQGDVTRGHVIVGLPPGSRHELGALGFAVALRRAGVSVAYVGPDLPADDWERAAVGAAGAAVGVVTEHDRRGALQVVRRLRADPQLVVAVGGAASHGVDEPGVVHLPPDLLAAARLFRDALRSASGA